MLISYKYRAYPDATTVVRLHAALDTCRWLYNTLLEEYNTTRENGKSRRLCRSIHSASWGRFFSYLSYRAESAGTELICVDPRDTT